MKIMCCALREWQSGNYCPETQISHSETGIIPKPATTIAAKAVPLGSFRSAMKPRIRGIGERQPKVKTAKIDVMKATRPWRWSRQQANRDVCWKGGESPCATFSFSKMQPFSKATELVAHRQSLDPISVPTTVAITTNSMTSIPSHIASGLSGGPKGVSANSNAMVPDIKSETTKLSPPQPNAPREYDWLVDPSFICFKIPDGQP